MTRSTDPDPDWTPSWNALFGANLRILLAASFVGALAYGLWRALRLLFPEVGWLQ